MIRIAISPAADAAIAGTLPRSVGVERERAENGDICIWLDPGVLAKLKALRGPGESYSDVITEASERRAGHPAVEARAAARPVRSPKSNLTNNCLASLK